MEETDHSNLLESKSSESDTHHASKKRRLGERVVVAVKLEENDKRQQRNEGPPSDCWSWRKYGQKPIKGSPYPRGYYRCSTSKGCSAKKQVEICKTDSSMLIVTYTSTHNHPSTGKTPNLLSPPNNQHNKQDQDEINAASTPKQVQEESESVSMVPRVAVDSQDHLQHSQSPFDSSADYVISNQGGSGDDLLEANLQTACGQEHPKSVSESMVPRVAVDSEDHLQHSQSPFNSSADYVISNQGGSGDNLLEANLQTICGQDDPKLESESMVPRVAVDSEDHLQHSQSPSDSSADYVISNQGGSVDNPSEANLQTTCGQEDPKLVSESMVARVAVDSEDHLQHPQSPLDSTAVHVISDQGGRGDTTLEANLQAPGGLKDPKLVVMVTMTLQNFRRC